MNMTKTWFCRFLYEKRVITDTVILFGKKTTPEAIYNLSVLGFLNARIIPYIEILVDIRTPTKHACINVGHSISKIHKKVHSSIIHICCQSV